MIVLLLLLLRDAACVMVLRGCRAQALEQLEDIRKALKTERDLRAMNSADCVAQVRRSKNQVLKSDVKKSMAVVRKVKNLSDETLEQLNTDITTVNLARHVSEVRVHDEYHMP
jgi:hypothetical protein